MDYLIWLAAILIVGLLIGSTWYRLRRRKSGSQKVSAEYFRGLNFLLNEEPDKAIEVFIRALEVDSETVELHLALGGLFRRKGQVDRATRIHQNLIARPMLAEEHRLLSIYELALDYDRAGLLDRAENLFLELLDSHRFRADVIEGLCRIYEKEKEWKKAIDITKQHKRRERNMHRRRLSHYWCELAEDAIKDSEFEAARRSLRSAATTDPSAVRPRLLEGELLFQQGQYKKALRVWQPLVTTDPAISALICGQVIRCFRQLEDDDGLKDYLLSLHSTPRDESAFNHWCKAMLLCYDQQALTDKLLSMLSNDGVRQTSANYLLENLQRGKIDTEMQTRLLRLVVGQANERGIEYTCGHCGFATKSRYWCCPNCGSWDSY